MAEYDGSPNKDSTGTQRGLPQRQMEQDAPVDPGTGAQRAGAASSGTDASRGTPEGMARTGGSAANENRHAGGERDVQAGQEGDRAAATLDNLREGYGGSSGSRQGRSTDAGESARDVARRQGENDA